MLSKFTVGGLPCKLVSPLSWALYRSPQHRVYNLPFVNADADSLLALTANDPIDIVIEGRTPRGSGQPKSVTLANLFIVGEAPTTSPFHRIVQFSDARYHWKDNHIRAFYNLRRVSTTRRIVSQIGLPLEVAQIATDVAFAKVTLKDQTRKWTAREVLEDILDRVAGAGNWLIRAASVAEGLVQDVIIDDSGEVALAKALALTPGLDCFQAADGTIIIDSIIPGAADGMIAALGTPTRGELRRVNLANRRAQAFRGLVTREIGYRFDFKGGLPVNDEDPYLLNMARTVLPETTINGEKLPMGSLVRIGALLEAMQVHFLATGIPELVAVIQRNPLDLANVRRLYQVLDDTYTKQGSGGISPDRSLSRLLAEIRRSLQRRFMVNPVYSDCCERILPKNPGFIDPETGAEQRSPTFIDHAVKPSGLAFARVRGTNRQLVYNVDGGVDPFRGGGSTSSQLKDATLTRSLLTMTSEQLGIFEIDLYPDAFGDVERVLPGQVDPDTIPAANYREVTATFHRAGLASGHKMNVILALVPFTPNDDRNLEAFEVSPGDVEARFGFRLGEAKGPLVKEKRFREGLITAQFPYDETKHDVVREILGIVRPPAGVTPPPQPPSLGDPINVEDIKELTLSSALTYYLQKMDHFAGEVEIPLRGDIEPIGEIQEVTFFFGLTGKLSTIVSCGQLDAEPLDALAFLPQSARRTLLRAANPTGA